MKKAEIAASLWQEWYFDSSTGKPMVFTNEHVPVFDSELVKESLARAIFRIGYSDSLGHAFRIVETSEVEFGYAGPTEEEPDVWTACDLAGETFYGYHVQQPTPVTWVEINTDAD